MAGVDGGGGDDRAVDEVVEAVTDQNERRRRPVEIAVVVMAVAPDQELLEGEEGQDRDGLCDLLSRRGRGHVVDVLRLLAGVGEALAVLGEQLVRERREHTERSAGRDKEIDRDRRMVCDDRPAGVAE